MAWESFSRIDLEALATPQIWERGQAYYQEGHLRKACQLGQFWRDAWPVLVATTRPNYGLKVGAALGM